MLVAVMLEIRLRAAAVEHMLVVHPVGELASHRQEQPGDRLHSHMIIEGSK